MIWGKSVTFEFTFKTTNIRLPQLVFYCNWSKCISVTFSSDAILKMHFNSLKFNETNDMGFCFF